MHKGPQGEWGFSHHYQAIQLPSGLTDAGMDLSTSFLFFLFFLFFLGGSGRQLCRRLKGQAQLQDVVSQPRVG